MQAAGQSSRMAASPASSPTRRSCSHWPYSLIKVLIQRHDEHTRGLMWRQQALLRAGMPHTVGQQRAWGDLGVKQYHAAVGEEAGAAQFDAEADVTTVPSTAAWTGQRNSGKEAEWHGPDIRNNPIVWRVTFGHTHVLGK